MLTYPHFDPTFPRDMWVLPKVLEHQAVQRADKPCLSWTDEGTPMTFSEVNAEVNRIAHGLLAEGVTKGDHVVLYMPNCLDFVLTWWALTKIGAIEVPVGEMQMGDFLRHQLTVSSARHIVTVPELVERVTAICTDVPKLECCFVVDDDAPAPVEGLDMRPYTRLVSDNRDNPGIEVRPDDVAAILYTSGTTGPSKGVIMPHSQFYFFAEEDLQLVGLTGDDVYMTGFPFFHGNAQFLTIYPCLIAGAHCVLYPKFSASDFFGRARRCKATVANLIGATMAFIAATPPRDDDRDHKIRTIYAAPLAFEMRDAFNERFGEIEFVDGFGQTEISNIFQTPRGVERPEGASGVLMDQWFEARIADPETDEPVPEGEVGELLIRHRHPGTISNGYMGMPEKTVETWRNLWFHTGDALRRDENGWYYFVDRIKDALRRRGENISSFEVESVVRKHAQVAECAVIGVKADEAGGEDEVKACVMLAEGVAALDHADVIAWCEARMPGFMVPRYIEVMTDFPRTPSEKVQKKKLREAGITPETWDRFAAPALCESKSA